VVDEYEAAIMGGNMNSDSESQPIYHEQYIYFEDGDYRPKTEDIVDKLGFRHTPFNPEPHPPTIDRSKMTA
jgi:hypothetical protein